MKVHKIIIILMLSLVTASGYAQKAKVRLASDRYTDLSYVKTSEILLDVANKGYKSEALLQKLANSYYFNNQMEDAAKWYGELMTVNENVDSEYYFRYAQSLKSIQNYEESDKWMKKFKASNKDDLRGKAFVSSVDYLSKIEKASREFEIVNLDINSPFSDFGTTLYNDQLVFSSSRESGKIYQWNGQPFLNIFAAKKQSDGSYGEVNNFDSNINSKYHESSASFNKEGDVMYFTRNNYLKRKYKNDAEGLNRLKIYKATLKDKVWGNIESVHFNSDEYSIAHPSVNTDGTRLYFASDMPGTSGSSDIYVAVINSDGSLGEPENLGTLINTEGQETFPFINSVGDLYFSSNGWSGLGGLDVFIIKDFENRKANKQPLIVENVGRPINSSLDDFGYYENLVAKEGFFTSNREGGKGDDDIYTFKIPECKQTIEGIVKDKNTQEIIAGATVILLDEKGNQISQIIVGEDAFFSFEVECEKEYLIRVVKDGYSSEEKRITTPNKKQELRLELNLEQDKQELKPGDDLAKILDIPIIYFDLDKSNIRKDSEIELQKVVAVLKKYPKMKIDIRSHTDSRASFKYNYDLSDRRNKSTIQYIIKGGIEAERLTGKGYGERKLVNKCSDGVECTEEEHQLNRRSEFIIVSM